jgi:hypothetical protein
MEFQIIDTYSIGVEAELVLGMTLNCIQPPPQGSINFPVPVLSPDKGDGWRYTGRKRPRRLKSAKTTTQVT